LRIERGLSQQQLAEKLFVNRSSVAHWESGTRVPNALLITRLANALGVEVDLLMKAAASDDSSKPCIIVIDDEKIILTGEVAALEKVFPNATIIGFSTPHEALYYAKCNNVNLVFSDIEMGKINGLDLCDRLLKINPKTNVIFLTAYADYSIEAWNSGACGFIVKPMTEEALRKQMRNLRHPIAGLL
jgi:CheY-like chemotaxis protein